MAIEGIFVVLGDDRACCHYIYVIVGIKCLDKFDKCIGIVCDVVVGNLHIIGRCNIKTVVAIARHTSVSEKIHLYIIASVESRCVKVEPVGVLT